METILLDGHHLEISQVVLTARGRHLGSNFKYPNVELTEAVKSRILEYRQGIQDAIKRNETMYGVNTGCGSKKGIAIPESEIIAYQQHYIPAHCTGFGEPYPAEITRAAMLLRVNSFAKGNSGISLELCEKILELLNKNVIPVVPQQGSVGSSGDLCPLAHLGALITGLDGQYAWYQGKKIPVAEALEASDTKPLQLGAKEAMGLTNGATFSLATAVLAYHDAVILSQQSNITMAMSLEAIRGELNAFDSRIHEARNHKGQVDVSFDLLTILEGSERVTSICRDIDLDDESVHLYPQDHPKAGKKIPRVQDAYSFRCYPQVAGSVLQTLEYAGNVLKNEINASTDNPLIFSGDKNGTYDVLSGGNFHGEPIAHVCDFLKIAIQSLANISNSRLYALLNAHTSYGLPDDLSGPINKDLNTGLMILQYSVAALVSENKVLCHPASVDSIPTSAGQEDYVSMAPIAARHLRQVVDVTYGTIAAELLGACQGISLTQEKLGNPKLGKTTSIVYNEFRKIIPEMDDDRFLQSDWSQAIEFIKNKRFNL